MSGRIKFKTNQMLMLVDPITAWGGYRKPAEGLPKPRECSGVWPSRCALFLALLLGTLSNEALLIARWLTHTHDDVQRANVREQLEPHTLARSTHRYSPISSCVSGPMHA